MMYPYVKYSDETEVSFSNIYIENDIECIDVHFERQLKMDLILLEYNYQHIK